MTDILHSMTGFAKIEDSSVFGNLSIEIRSINHRYLDLHLRIPEIFRSFEIEMRNYLTQNLGRGKIDVFVSFIPSPEIQNIELNQPLLETLKLKYEELSQSFKLGSINFLSLLQFPDVLIQKRIDENDIKNTFFLIFEKAVYLLKETRAHEGSKLHEFMISRINEIKELCKSYHLALPQWVKAHHLRLEKRVLDLKTLIEPERLQQEIAFWLQKTDVAEELQRLESHLFMLNSILETGGKIGRQLEFYIQELNREANTLGAKAIDAEASHLAIQIKVLIEQMREQVQNIE